MVSMSIVSPKVGERVVGGLPLTFCASAAMVFSRPFPEMRGEGVRARADTRGVCTFCTISSVCKPDPRNSCT